MVSDLIGRLQTVLVELKAEGNTELAARVEQAIDDLRRSEAGPFPRLPPNSHTAAP